MRGPAGASGTPTSWRYRATAGFWGESTHPWKNMWVRDKDRWPRPATLRAGQAYFEAICAELPGSPEKRPAELGRRMIARRRRVGRPEPDVPEYLVDNSSIGDERDDSHSAPAAGTKERIFLPDLPNELRPSYAPRFEPLAFIAVGVIGRACRCLFSAARHPALSGSV